MQGINANTPPVHLHQPESVAQPEPFDELKLTDTTIEGKLKKLNSKGYFSIRMNASTLDFLKGQAASNTEDKPWKPEYAGFKALNVAEPGYERKVTATAEKIVAKIESKNTVELRTNEFEIRKFSGNRPMCWHQDKEPKNLTCIATLAGTGTEFVSPEIAADKFEPKNPDNKSDIKLVPKSGNNAISQDVKRAKKNKFYFFAARGIANATIPKLVHRAPDEPDRTKAEDRTIFLARWLPATRKQMPFDPQYVFSGQLSSTNELAAYPLTETPSSMPSVSRSGVKDVT